VSTNNRSGISGATDLYMPPSEIFSHLKTNIGFEKKRKFVRNAYLTSLFIDCADSIIFVGVAIELVASHLFKWTRQRESVEPSFKKDLQTDRQRRRARSSIKLNTNPLVSIIMIKVKLYFLLLFKISVGSRPNGDWLILWNSRSLWIYYYYNIIYNIDVDILPVTADTKLNEIIIKKNFLANKFVTARQI
jgi:hypothetical protein